jgi:hypothetical protein
MSADAGSAIGETPARPKTLSAGSLAGLLATDQKL